MELANFDIRFGMEFPGFWFPIIPDPSEEADRCGTVLRVKAFCKPNGVHRCQLVRELEPAACRYDQATPRSFPVSLRIPDWMRSHRGEGQRHATQGNSSQ
jgi:hypothetical protein